MTSTIREALEFYANPKNWWVRNREGLEYHQANLTGSMERLAAQVGVVEQCERFVHPQFYNDCGERAKKALAEMTAIEDAPAPDIESIAYSIAAKRTAQQMGIVGGGGFGQGVVEVTSSDREQAIKASTDRVSVGQRDDSTAFIAGLAAGRANDHAKALEVLREFAIAWRCGDGGASTIEMLSICYDKARAELDAAGVKYGD